MSPIITLLTDFGHEDPFVGIMKGVILGIAPRAQIVDLAHGLSMGDIRAAAFHLRCAIKYFPAGTIHVVVVDPGVGSSRRAIAVKTKRSIYVAPDNGALTLALKEEPPEKIVVLTEARYLLNPVSATFHGRDVFAPVAAHLAAGLDIGHLGPATTDMCRIDWPEPERFADGSIRGAVVHIDRFGNCVTNITRGILSSSGNIVLSGGSWQAPLASCYAAAPGSAAVAVIGSAGCVEIAVRGGNAARQLGLEIGSLVLCKAS